METNFRAKKQMFAKNGGSENRGGRLVECRQQQVVLSLDFAFYLPTFQKKKTKCNNLQKMLCAGEARGNKERKERSLDGEHYKHGWFTKSDRFFKNSCF